MTGIGLWRINDDSPSRLSTGAVGLERNLEEWIEHDPALLERGLVIVGRQLRLEGGALDLLALDPQGRWVLIEIKRDRLRRDVIAQAIDYASCLKNIDAETLRRHCDGYLAQRNGGTLDVLLRERGRTIDDDEDLELIIYLVGAGVDPGLERMVGFLGDQASLAIRIVTFSVFNDPSGGVLLAREIHEHGMPDAPGATQRGTRLPAMSEEELLARARDNGIGAIVETIYDAAITAGLHPRLYAKSVMFAPPQNKTRCMIYLPIDRPDQLREGKIGVWVAADVFEEYYGIPETDVERELGASGRVYTDLPAAQRIAEGLSKLFSQQS